MKKTLFIISFILIALLFSFSNAYATDAGNKVVNGIKETTNGASDMVQDAANGTGNAIKNGATTLRDGAENAANNAGQDMQNAGNDIKNAAGDVGNDMRNAADNAGNDMQNMANNDGYTATRTSTENQTNNTGNWISQNMWTWIVIGIITIAIVALIWYYASRNND